MSKNNRLKQIETALMQYGIVNVVSLSCQLSVSEMTIRRDLDILVSQGKAVRTHGGAVSPHEHIGDIYMDSRSLVHITEKKAIAKEAVNHLHTGDVIFVDDSSTVGAMAEFISRNLKLTITTSSMPAALEFNKLPNTEVICLGGLVSKTTKSVTGPLSTDLIENMHFKTAFLGVPYISPDGIISTSSFDEYGLKRAVMNHSSSCILLIDSSKLHTEIKHLQLAHADEFSLIITDYKIREDFALFCTEHHIPLQTVHV